MSAFLYPAASNSNLPSSSNNIVGIANFNSLPSILYWLKVKKLLFPTDILTVCGTSFISLVAAAYISSPGNATATYISLTSAVFTSAPAGWLYTLAFKSFRATFTAATDVVTSSIVAGTSNCISSYIPSSSSIVATSCSWSLSALFFILSLTFFITAFKPFISINLAIN